MPVKGHQQSDAKKRRTKKMKTKPVCKPGSRIALLGGGAFFKNLKGHHYFTVVGGLNNCAIITNKYNSLYAL